MREHLKDYIEHGTTTNVRGLRILVEYFHASDLFDPLKKEGIKIVSVFGSARTHPKSPEYRIPLEIGKRLYQAGFAVVTGASRGVMQAANQGVAEAIAAQLVREGHAKSIPTAMEGRRYHELLKRYSIGLKITLPFEPGNNPYVGAYGTFHYFMVRKFFFGSLSSGFIACEGGWGTRDELYEILTLVQTGKAPLMPIVYVAKNARHFRQDLQHALKKGYIDPEDMELVAIVPTAARAAREITSFYRRVESIQYADKGQIRIALKSPLPRPVRQRLIRMAGLLKRVATRLEITPQAVVIHGFNHSSYGHIRRVVNAINS